MTRTFTWQWNSPFCLTKLYIPSISLCYLASQFYLYAGHILYILNLYLLLLIANSYLATQSYFYVGHSYIFLYFLLLIVGHPMQSCSCSCKIAMQF